ncbi:interleukin-6-like [Pangasianodon hypophthalmus]|uniref:interleukin-6-like n=1 Tax=Pangasianodon hypophthalmus TaxID=310915 RepID=UPI002307DDED|nr:interleukin-6-like [Pangasianodon hypophthalmus]
MPSLLPYPGLFLLALLPLASLGLYSGDTDFYETSGSQLQNEAHAPDHKWLSIARQMRRDIASVRDEQLKRDFADTSSEFASVRIQTPLLSSSDGCLPSDFTAHKCLRRIYNGLRVYQAYLPYVERENLTAAHMVDIKVGITRLLHLIKETVKVNDDKVHPSSLNELPDDSTWTRKTVTHSILHNFADFMTDTSRAINYMKNIKVGR